MGLFTMRRDKRHLHLIFLCPIAKFLVIGLPNLLTLGLNLPLHLSPMGEKYGGRLGDCAVTERVSDQLVRLPFYTNMTELEQGHVIDTLQQFRV